MDPNPNDSNNPDTEVARVSVKLPPVWKKNINTWFIQIDAIFRKSNIKSESTKYDYVVAALDPDIADMVSDYLINPSQTVPYTELRTRLVAEFSESDGSRIKKLLTELELGDKKPSQLLREMRSLANAQVTDQFLKTMFLQHMPVNIRSILAPSSDALDKQAEMADKIMEYSPQHSVHSVARQPFANTSGNPSQDRMARLEEQLAELTASINDLKFRSRSHSRGKSPLRSRSSMSPGSRTTSSTRMCWYHFKFSDKAKKCIPPCTFSASSEN
ncbi:unnamed protein product [Nesidiocoris tenuis]|uniref:DUF7041 domain-containing protein n=1 Tax=Nesidiocoris tenuis TaxID=355587 RepID=A0A6H5G4T1_9HEMI|nr:unnamed protein product [Nesidiocoris tenuis]